MSKKDDVFELIDKFYEYKSNYEDKYNNIKTKKDYKTMDRKGKKAKLLNFKKKCINCGNVGGTFFSTKNHILECYCNAEKTSEKCKFHIKIQLGRINNVIQYKELIKENIEEIKADIMKLKLDLLFNLEKEDIVLREFELHKDELEEQEKYLTIFNEVIEKNYIFEKDTDEEKIKDSRKNLIKSLNIRIKNDINYYNKLLKQYKTEENENILKDAITTYIESILPLMEQKFEIQYQTYVVEDKKEDNVMKKVIYNQFINDFNKQVQLNETKHRILINNK
tara:strand:- start:16 stop:852 length:837 start_codon:yes stop_codon:yes gene_type:complete